MPGPSRIEWTDATWNPVTGCTKVSKGCDHCYAADLAHGRLTRRYVARLPVVDSIEARADPFAVRLWPERLEQPLRWREPRRIFVNSMSDLFHADIPPEYIRQVFDVMLGAPHHNYQVLTKRPARAAAFLRRHMDLCKLGVLPPHVWIGTSVEDQQAAYRVRHLREIPALIRFISFEPLLGPMDPDLLGVSWVIVGGESGPSYRSLDMDWVRTIRDACLAERVPFFFKQVGGRTPKAGGRTLDGKTWNQYPDPVEVATTAGR